MTDIVEQLRHRADWDVIAFSSFDPQMCIDAADEIEQLRARVEACESVIAAAVGANKTLQDLITEWADATDTYWDSGDGRRRFQADLALRKAVGR
jgi:hypothetical protein